MDRGTAYPTLDRALEDLVRRGFTTPLRVVDGRLSVVGTGETLGRAGLVIREFHRFEGISDPDDMAILYAIEGAGGVRGTLADAFGVYSDPAVSAALEGVPIRPRPTDHAPA